MPRIARIALTIAFALALPAYAVAATPGAAPTGAVTAAQAVGTAELQRFIYRPDYPVWCGDADQQAREMRVKPSTDPSRMHAIMAANIMQCANTEYATRNAAVWNTAVFAAAAAALIAARNEPPAAALQDARHAKNWSGDIMAFTHGNADSIGGNAGFPSAYSTNANRINKDAIALLAAIQAALAANATPAAADALPAHPKPVASGAAAAPPSPAALPSAVASPH